MDEAAPAAGRSISLAATAWLLDPETGRRYFLAGPLTLLGRAPGSAHLALTGDPYLSRRHARIVCDAGGYWFQDLGSVNGSFLNQRRLDAAPQRLRPGDMLQLGNTALRFETAQMEVAHA